MSNSIIYQLVLKDWQLIRKYIAGYALTGLLAVAVAGSNHQGAQYVGAVLLISSVIIIGVHLVFSTVVLERKNKTLALVMSLPISVKEYTSAKLIGNLSLFSGAWLVILMGGLLSINLSSSLPMGFIPFLLIFLLHLFAVYVACLALSIITESEIVATVVVTAGSILISPFIYFLTSRPGIYEHMGGDSPVWNTTAMAFLVTEVLAIILMIAATYYFQARKTDFI